MARMTRLETISATQDKRDGEMMRGLVQMRAEYPGSYKMLREAVAVHRAETAYKCYLKVAYSDIA